MWLCYNLEAWLETCSQFITMVSSLIARQWIWPHNQWRQWPNLKLTSYGWCLMLFSDWTNSCSTSGYCYTTLTNFSTIYLVMCKVYTYVGGIKKFYHVCPHVRKIIHSLKLKDYLHVQADNPWYNYYLVFGLWAYTFVLSRLVDFI